MTKPEVNGDKQPPGQISLDEVKTRVANLDEAGKQTVAAEATKSASDEAKPGLVTQVVRNAGNVEARKAAVAEAVNSASPENKVQVAGKAVEQLSPQQQKEVAREILPHYSGHSRSNMDNGRQRLQVGPLGCHSCACWSRWCVPLPSERGSSSCSDPAYGVHNRSRYLCRVHRRKGPRRLHRRVTQLQSTRRVAAEGLPLDEKETSSAKRHKKDGCPGRWPR